MVERIWLDVPFAEKDAAKAAGARWDPAEKRWYAPREGMEALRPWTALPEVPELLPGEDRTFGAGLFVDLVPTTCWFTNVRSCTAPRDWERLRRMITRRAGWRCEICGAAQDAKSRRRLEAHERWHYDEAERVQALRRLICLCDGCHTVTHFGLAQVRGVEEEARRQLCAVTGMSEAAAEEHVAAAFELWSRRSRIEWSLDLSMLTDAGITLRTPPEAGRRPDVAARTLGGGTAGGTRRFG
ncbi:hypothetical protein FHR84_002554 [Actinopolyspora biskrensis]|uniref:DUF5710 domain-containing protein n=1 Tax=Actinopolyspora biskrensis TaxID=1470178 RepID=A0A852YYY8_9ACTN|nr:DUF5710 domain-containing protein [Actinopolyspora biskrensis]NYH79220.1 hypothetical protein [Actinopolyspora biskrensis]